jgi:hypothetical protein
MAAMSKDRLLDRLQDASHEFADAVYGLTQEQMGYIFEGSDGWTSVGDVVRHLIGAERGMLTVARRCAAGEEPPGYEGFDLDRWNARQVEKLRALTPAQALDKLQAVRQETLSTLVDLTDEQIALPASHPFWGSVTVGELFRIIAIHQEMHRKDVVKMRGSM